MEQARRAQRIGGQVHPMVYAQHGHRLMRLKSSIRGFRYLISRIAKVLAKGKGVAARRGLKEAGVQNCEPTDRNVI